MIDKTMYTGFARINNNNIVINFVAFDNVEQAQAIQEALKDSLMIPCHVDELPKIRSSWDGTSFTFSE